MKTKYQIIICAILIILTVVLTKQCSPNSTEATNIIKKRSEFLGDSIKSVQEVRKEIVEVLIKDTIEVNNLKKRKDYWKRLYRKSKVKKVNNVEVIKLIKDTNVQAECLELSNRLVLADSLIDSYDSLVVAQDKNIFDLNTMIGTYSNELTMFREKVNLDKAILKDKYSGKKFVLGPSISWGVGQDLKTRFTVNVSLTYRMFAF